MNNTVANIISNGLKRMGITKYNGDDMNALVADLRTIYSRGYLNNNRVKLYFMNLQSIAKP
jgi:hypothetical protein